MEKIITLKLKEMYESMICNSKRRGHTPPKMSLVEFNSWIAIAPKETLIFHRKGGGY